MRKATQGLITACAGLVAGAAFGATPALAGPSWIPPGHVLGYYGSVGDCTSYASSLVLWDADYDCDYWPQRISRPYALVIQRPVLIAQPDYDEPGEHDDHDEPVAPEPDMEEPPVSEPPVVKEPDGGALSEKPVKAIKSHKKAKANKAHKAHKQGKVMSDEPMDEPGCPPVADDCTDVLAVAVAPVRPVVPVVRPVVPIVHHHPLVGPWHHPWPL